MSNLPCSIISNGLSAPRRLCDDSNEDTGDGGGVKAGDLPGSPGLILYSPMRLEAGSV